MFKCRSLKLEGRPSVIWEMKAKIADRLITNVFDLKFNKNILFQH